MISRRVLSVIGISAAVVVVTAAIWEAVLNDLYDHIGEAVESLGREINPFSHSEYEFERLADYNARLDGEDGYEMNRMEPLEKWVY